jgi:hypothetical protein
VREMGCRTHAAASAAPFERLCVLCTAAARFLFKNKQLTPAGKDDSHAGLSLHEPRPIEFPEFEDLLVDLGEPWA